MIIIDGYKADIHNIMSQYPYDNIQRDIINRLSSSKTEYNYNAVDQLKFELLLRKEIIKAANELNESGMKFEIFSKSRCNPKYWNRQNNGGFLLKPGVTPSEAILDIFRNAPIYATECSTAMDIIYYKALINIFPRELFNKLFPKIYLKNWHSLDKLLKDIKLLKKENDYLPGDRRYIANPDFDPMFPEYQGENVIDMGHGLYYGHGIGKNEVKTIISELNKFRKRGSKRSAYLKNSAGRVNFKNLAKIYYDYRT